ncbi:hypothetical protein CS063_02585 [Sporanaerobium hydrogeniformans]|uniref:Uncharacterized protein n=1 Tax=Sporanaerobium hydrogeniformans TaxID=3072179 RepID=A0AC61DI49_9FIRM|nr:trypsin-like peptidase domain-containing protein [Sporanaerobium hydrogeniformans]PHV72383.1 hypothetical protein CS063_02585 [Sporanaerobium hydrogeniformans]
MFDEDLNKEMHSGDKEMEEETQSYEWQSSREDASFKEESQATWTEPVHKASQKKKSSFGRFVVGLLIVSVVGGGAIGTSFAFLSPYATDYYNTRYNKGGTLSPNGTDIQQGQEVAPKLVATTTPVVDIAKNIGPCVVSIKNNKVVATWFGEFNQSGLGSGVIFKEDDSKIYIVTNAHVVEGANSLVVNFLGNTKVEAELIGGDTLTDIAVVAVAKKNVPEEALAQIRIAPLGDSDKLQVGELAVAIGTPIGEAYNNTVTGGYISALNREVQISQGEKTLNLIQTDAAINPGNSGGALVGATGEVIGINSVKLAGEVEGMGFAIPINDVKPIIAEILTSGRISRPVLGIVGTDISAKSSELFELPMGIYIEQVVEGGSADLAGIKVDDILFEFDGVKITGMTQLKELLNKKKVGDVVQVKVLRGNGKKTIDVKLREAPSAY